LADSNTGKSVTIDGNVVAELLAVFENPSELWVCIDGSWSELNLSEIAEAGRPLSKEAFESRFSARPPLPGHAFGLTPRYHPGAAHRHVPRWRGSRTKHCWTGRTRPWCGSG
jgi:hypothetical protein